MLVSFKSRGYIYGFLVCVAVLCCVYKTKRHGFQQKNYLLICYFYLTVAHLFVITVII